jgi:hypothetical protein
MKIFLSLLSIPLLILALAGIAQGDDKKDKKGPLPDHAVWELKPLNSLFRVVQTDYDAEANKVVWTVETRNGCRTSDFVREITRRPFTFRFLNGDGGELATVQLTRDHFQGLPERIMAERTRLRITLNLPRAMPRTKKVVLQRGASE